LNLDRQQLAFGAHDQQPRAFPPINVFQQGDAIPAIIELPGIDKSELHVQAKKNARPEGLRATDHGTIFAFGRYSTARSCLVSPDGGRCCV
jgi:HSP20 family molecular chaperone IbpA